MPINPLLLLGLGGAIAAAYSQRKTIMVYGKKALQAGYEKFFTVSLPTRAQPHAATILRVAKEEDVDPFLIFALGDRETLWGTSKYLDKPGPGGRGDAGHGHGLMQIDDRSFGAWIAANPWWDPYTNVKKGTQILKAKMAFFTSRNPVKNLVVNGYVLIGDKSATARGISAGSYRDPRPLSGAKLFEAAVAAYNTGEGNVLMSIAAGLPAEKTSAGGDYFTDVTTRMAAAASTFSKTAGV